MKINRFGANPAIIITAPPVAIESAVNSSNDKITYYRYKSDATCLILRITEDATGGEKHEIAWGAWANRQSIASASWKPADQLLEVAE